MSKDAAAKWRTYNMGPGEQMHSEIESGRKHDGSGWTEKGSLVSHNRLVPNTGVGVKEGGDWWDKECRKTGMARFGSKSSSRKAASAIIAKIPFPLAQYIAKHFACAE